MDTLELHRAAADRELETPEIHSSNDFYGHAHILKKFAGLPPNKSLKVVIEHAIFLKEDFHWDIDLKTKMPVFLCAASPHALSYTRKVRGKKKAIAIGPMISYVEHMPIKFDPTAENKILLAFPGHSTHTVRAIYDAANFADQIEKYCQEGGFSHALVCIYWKDILQGVDKIFLERGFNCVTAGHIYDFQFLPRLKGYIEAASAIITNDIGSHLLYSVILNKPVVYYPQEIRHENRPAFLGTREEIMQEPTVDKMVRLFSEPSVDISPKQKQLVEDITGLSNVKTQQQMKAIFADAEHRYCWEMNKRRIYSVLRHT